MNDRVYLDWNATAPLCPEAKSAIEHALAVSGNASSIHTEGRRARRLVEEARSKVAALTGAEPRAVTFTSGGTEANVLALVPEYECQGGKRRFDRLLVSAIEHPSVRAGGRFDHARVETIPVNSAGSVDLHSLERQLAARAGENVLVSVMLANNETGVIQPVRAVAERVHRMGGFLHVDAVQAPGKITCDISELDADFLTLSAHKLGGPAGCGALVKRNEGLRPLPLVPGSQEHGQRGGTENLSGIAGFGAAAARALEDLRHVVEPMRRLRGRLEEGLRAINPKVVIFGEEAERLPNTTLFAVRGAKAETLVIGFDLERVAVSSGSACSSGKVALSPVLEAMGVDSELAKGAIRVSFGVSTTKEAVDQLLNAWKKLSAGLHEKSAGLAA